MMTSSDLNEILAKVDDERDDLVQATHAETRADPVSMTKVPAPAVLPAIALLEKAKADKVKESVVRDVRHDFLLRQALSTEFVAGVLACDSPLAPRRVNEAASPPTEARELPHEAAPQTLTLRPPVSKARTSTKGLLQPQAWQGLAHDLNESYPSQPSPSPPARRSRSSRASRSSDEDRQQSHTNKENDFDRPRISFGSNAIYADLSPLSPSF